MTISKRDFAEAAMNGAVSAWLDRPPERRPSSLALCQMIKEYADQFNSSTPVPSIGGFSVSAKIEFEDGTVIENPAGGFDIFNEPPGAHDSQAIAAAALLSIRAAEKNRP